MNFEQLKDLVAQGECEVLEFKATTGQIVEAGKTLCGLLNKKGGTLLIGVKENGEILGQQVTDKTQQEIAQILNEITPSAPIDLQIVDLPNTLKKVIVLKTSPTVPPAVYHFKDKAYERVGSSTLSIKYERLRYLLLERTLDRNWDQLAAQNYVVDDLDGDEIFRTVKDGVSSGRLSESVLENNDIFSILQGLNLTVGTDLTNAAVVLFSKKITNQFLQCEVKMARFKGTTKNIGFIDEKQYVGNAFKILDEAEAFVRRHLNIAIEFSQKSFQRIETPQLPFVAIREAIINSICHRDYVYDAASISLAIYDDRLEIWNIGKLPTPLMPQDLKAPHQSILRNKNIAHVFYVRKYIEKWGSGTIRIVKLCKELGVPDPEFSEYSGGFSVTFRFNQATVTQSDKKEYVKFTERQKLIVELLSHHKALSLRDIIELMPEKFHERLIRDDLYFLKEKEVVDLKGKGRGAKWFLLRN